MPPGDARVRYEGEDFWARALTPRIEPGAVARLELELVTGAELAGLVTWPDGRPAAGARVAAAAEDRAEETRIVTGFTSPLAPGEGEVLTGADGSFRLSGLQPGRYRVLARAAVMEPSASVPVFWKAVSAAVPGDTLDLALVLDAGLSVTGTTRDEGAAPLAGVAILARPSLEEARVDDLVVGTSKADGSFALTGLAPGAWELDVSLEGYARLEKRLVLPSSVPLELVLLRGAIVSGFVQDEEHVLLPGASVSAQGASGA